MKAERALRVSGRSEEWLRSQLCAVCERDLWSALRHGCGRAVSVEKQCTPAAKNFSDGAYPRVTRAAHD